MSKEREATREAISNASGAGRPRGGKGSRSAAAGGGAGGSSTSASNMQQQQQQQQNLQQALVVHQSAYANNHQIISGGGGAVGHAINTSTPCAACKLLRRRCAQECPFAPYFSPHEPQRFASVHKIYGASNVSKMLSEVPEIQRADAANSLVYEANARIRDPVYGCMGVVSTLQQQAQALQAELNAVRNEVMRYRAVCHEVAAMQQAAAAAAAAAEAVQQHHQHANAAVASAYANASGAGSNNNAGNHPHPRPDSYTLSSAGPSPDISSASQAIKNSPWSPGPTTL